MPLGDLIKDPETGKIKPAVLIGGAGIGIAGVFLLMSKGGSSGSSGGVVSNGQSGDNTEAIKQLSDAVLGLAAIQKQGGSPDIASIPPTTTAVTKPSNSGLSGAPVVTNHHVAIHITGKTPVYNAAGKVVKYISSGTFSAAPLVHFSTGVKNSIDPKVGTGYFQIGTNQYLKQPQGHTAESKVAGHYSFKS